MKSRYVLVVDNVSSVTTSKDIAREFDWCGKIRDVVRDPKHRCSLIEFERADDCSYAWRKMDGFRIDGRTWKVAYASPEDFKFFGWKWFEGSPDRGRSRSRSHSRSKSPPNTPYHKDGRMGEASSSPPRSPR